MIAVSFAASLSLASAPALADETARLRTLFQEGVALEAAGDFASALKKFQEVAQVKRTAQVTFHIALCQEKLGQFVEALGGFRMAAGEAEKDAKLADVQKTITTAIDSLEKRIPQLTVKRGAGASSASISVDGVKIGPAQIGTAMKVNPGPHQVQATRGKETFKEELDLAEGASKTVTVKLAGDESAAGGGGDEPKPPPPPAPTKETSVLPYVIGGVGVVSLAASGVFFLMRSSAKSDLDAQCIDTLCPTSAKASGDKAKSMGTLGAVTLGLGVVAIGAAGVMLLSGGDDSAPKKDKEKESAAINIRVRLSTSPSALGATLLGTF